MPLFEPCHRSGGGPDPLAHGQGLSYKDIAALLTISPETVKKHLALALADLRRLLALHFPDSANPSTRSGRSDPSEAAG